MTSISSNTDRTDPIETIARAEKPCSRCEGINVTWGNVDQIHICDRHRAEIIREMHANPQKSGSAKE